MGGPSGSPLTGVRKNLSDSEVKKERPRIRRVSRKMSRQEPSSSSEQESPNKPQRRRRSSVFAPPIYGFEMRDRSASLSSRASLRRKMSVTGNETGKIPCLVTLCSQFAKFGINVNVFIAINELSASQIGAKLPEQFEINVGQIWNNLGAKNGHIFVLDR
ncbi:unnamed protein product [Nesidiocoris tenuis]|uniref:Uncharacterized protein n=1 Tax=Nesidiocoris tenuis TaxID=355587 RepID=A0A6H5HG56_9HEMI|nr:unnamed protein product [Nesidiocoris tenuis]